MNLNRCFRYSLRSFMLVTALIAATFGFVVTRLNKQKYAIEVIHSNGGVVALFNEWIVIGNTRQIERDLPPELSSQQVKWIFNKSVREVQIDYQHYNDQVREALHSLPTLERIHLVGHESQTAVARLQADFPNVEIFDVKELCDRAIR